MHFLSIMGWGSLSVVILIAQLAAASPINTAQSPWSASTEPINEDMEALLNKYAPIVKLSIVEVYYPSSIEYMLPHYSFSEAREGGRFPLNSTLLTPPLLDHLPQLGRDQFLSIEEEHNPQPFLLDEKAEYLYGPAGQEDGMKRGSDGRGMVEEDIYGFWVDQGKGVVDLWYWTFYPFNFGKPVGPFGVLGNHVGDWEHLRLRTVNGTAISVDYHSHNGGAFSAGTTRWSDVPQVDGRPVAYSAAGSHGLWPTPGDHVFANVLDVFKLVDITDDKGAIWDTKNHVVASQYWAGPQSRRKIWHGGDRAWLNFRGLWGNRGESDCWWFKLVGNCQLVDAPPGPNRWFGSPPDCIPSPISWETSDYTFVLSDPAVKWAEDHNIVAVQVEQICARPKRKKDDQDDDDDDDDDDDEQSAKNDRSERTVDYVHDDTKDEDLEIWTITGTAPFRHHDKQEVTVMPCRGVRSAVKAYKVSLCRKDGKSVTTSNERRICTYQEGKKGYRFGHAARVDDIDEWMWNLGP